MAPRLPEACSHIFEAIAEIRDYVAGLSDAEIAGDTMRVRAIERCIEIISEAVRHIPEDARAGHPQIPWRNIEDIGNMMRHGYFAVNFDVVLRVARFELEPLAQAIEKISPISLKR